MPAQSQTLTEPAWFAPLAQPGVEFPPTALPVLAGHLPPQIRGTLYRNGPGRLERGGQSVGHWFDGDGAILAVHFTETGATGLYRYVQTEGYQAESEANQFLYGNYGMTAPGPLWNQWMRPTKNAANTSVLPLPDRLLALWEGGSPHALNLETLETIGLDNLDELGPMEPYSAHAKQDPITGEIFNFGIAPGAKARLLLYRSDRTGKIIQRGALELDGVPMIHDFALAGRFLVFFIPPVRLNPFPILLGLRSLSDELKWQPDKGTQILVFDRATLTLVSRGETEPWFQWHFSNGCYEDATNRITLDLVRYNNFQTNQYLKEVPTGRLRTLAEGTLWRVQLDSKTAKVLDMQQLVTQSCEFPVVDPRLVGQPWRYTYLSTHRPGVVPTQELLGTIARYDSQTGELTIADAGPNCYPSESLYIPNPPDPGEGWVMTVVYNGDRQTSEVWIYEDDLAGGPICRLGLPQIIPFSFHGRWLGA
ncbi:MAG: carotenoid oxygenase family protein [Leptolyngbyaceae cyanobacterium bins.59]|nr:carotenoid oxygenase family protein [Leptolyngbyaceae cyanobacterium bins.59]